LLPDIAGGQTKADRMASLVTGGDMEKILAVPKIQVLVCNWWMLVCMCLMNGN